MYVNISTKRININYYLPQKITFFNQIYPFHVKIKTFAFNSNKTAKFHFERFSVSKVNL